MSPEQIAWLLTAYTRALAISTGRSLSFPAALAHNLELEGREPRLDATTKTALAATVASLRKERPVYPDD